MSFVSRGYTPPRSSSSHGLAPSVSRGPSTSALTAGKSIVYGSNPSPSQPAAHHRGSSQVAASLQSAEYGQQYGRSHSVLGSSSDAYPPSQPRTPPLANYSHTESTASLPVVRNPRAEESKASLPRPSIGSSPSRALSAEREAKQDSPVAAGSGVMMELDHTIGLASARTGALLLHPDGRRSISIVGSAVVVSSLTDPSDQTVLRGHDDSVTCIAVSPSGRLVASGQTGENADVVVWDLRSGAQRYRLSEHFHGITAVAFSEDELFLVTVGDALDKKMYVWDLSTGNIVSSTPVPPLRAVRWGGRVRDAKGRPTHLYVLAAATPAEPTVLTWALDPATGELQLDKCKTGTVQRQYSTLEFSRAEEMLFAGSESGDVVLFHTRSHMLQGVFPACALGVGALVVVPIPSAEGPQELVVVGGGDGSVTGYRYSRPTGPATARAGPNWVAHRSCRLGGAVTSLSLARPADPAAPITLVAATALGQVFSIPIAEGAEWRPVLSSEHPVSPLTAVSFAPGASDRFVTASVDGSIRVWSAVDYAVSVRIQCQCAVRAIAATEDFIVAGCADGVNRSSDPRTGQAMWSIPDAHRDGVECLSVSANRRFIVSGGVRGEVRAWDVRTRELLCNLKEHQLAVTGLALMADGKHAVSCSRDRSVLCWDLQQERRVSAHKQNMGAILGLALCPHPVGSASSAQAASTTVLTVGQEKSVTLWDLRQPRPLRIQPACPDPNAEATCVAVGNKQSLYATAGSDQTVRLWDAASGRQLASVHAHSSAVASLQFSGDDRQIVSVGADGAICIINVFSL